MDFRNLKDSITPDNKFILISVILNGITGLLFLSFMAGTGILRLLFSSYFIFFIGTIVDTIWIGYAISNLIVKRKIESKDFLYIFLLIPIFAVSFMGQIGNSEAFSVLFGDVGRELYNSYVVIIHMFMIYKIFKSMKKGA